MQYLGNEPIPNGLYACYAWKNTRPKGAPVARGWVYMAHIQVERGGRGLTVRVWFPKMQTLGEQIQFSKYATKNSMFQPCEADELPK